MNEEKCHFIGIGGIGMSALAKILLEKKCSVSGSDINKTQITKTLEALGAKVFYGHSKEHVERGQTVIFSSDIAAKNCEYEIASHYNCKLLHRSDLLKELMKGKKCLAVTGTHGKTTTSCLLATVLETAKMEPSFAIGGILVNLKTNGQHGQGEYFVAEADESDGTHLKYLPYAAIVTNMDLDHMNHFKTEENLKASFKAFFAQAFLKENIFFCGDDLKLRSFAEGVSYGFLTDNQLVIKNYRQKGWSSFFDIEYQEKTYLDIELALLGRHNALNAAAVFGLALRLKIEVPVILEAFKHFKGVLRRCEKKGFHGGILFLDDYAHHPAEIKATLKGVREAILEKKLIAVYQPHRYSRTKDLLGHFKEAFQDASELIVTDIYGAGEEKIEGISHQNILEELKDLRIPVRYIPRKELAKTLKKELFPHDVVLSLGAGDIMHLTDEVLKNFEPLKKIKVGLVFGGKSGEHEISIKSARYIAGCLNPNYYEPYFFAISKQGVWQMGEHFLNEDAISYTAAALIDANLFTHVQQCDLLFPVLHGSFGEDGTIQGFFEMLDKPYVGSDFRSSSVAMDKIMTKQIAHLNGIAVVPFVGFFHYEWKRGSQKIIKEISEKLKFPLYVKPAHLGSALAVNRVENEKELIDAIEAAFKHDSRILAEEEIRGREIEFAVLGNEEIEAFHPGEIYTEGNTYTYEKKYLSSAMKTTPKANLSDEKVKEGVLLAKKAYAAIGAEGLSRVDFFLDSNQKFWLNEINPIPGFTSISLYPSMCALHGLKEEALIDRLICLALEKKRRQKHYAF